MAGYRDGDDTGIVIRVGPIAAGDHGCLTEIIIEAIVNTISLFYSSKHHVCGLSTTEEADISHVYYKPHGITGCRPQPGSAWDDVPKTITFQMGGIQLPWDIKMHVYICTSPDCGCDYDHFNTHPRPSYVKAASTAAAEHGVQTAKPIARMT